MATSTAAQDLHLDASNHVAAMNRQVNLEEEMLSLGVERYRAMNQTATEKGAETRTTYGRRLMSSMHGPMREALDEWIVEADNATGRRPVALRYLKQFDPDLVCALTCRALVDRMSGRAAYANTAIYIGTALETEERAGELERERVALFRWMKRQMLEKGSSESWKRSVVTLTINRQDVDIPKWPRSDKLHVGHILIDIACRATGVFERQLQRTGPSIKDQQYILRPMPEIVEACRNVVNRQEMASPCWMPTIIPPKPWTNPRNGGYWVAGRLPLVKSHKHNFVEELNGMVEDMQDAYDAINTVQSVPWKVNAEVLEVAETMWDNLQGGLAGMPPADDLALPPKPHNIGDDKDARKAWKREAAKVHERNAKMGSRRLLTIRTLALARRFAPEPTIFFPMQYDFRGRMYAVPKFLQPQGDDLQKGLLTFAEGKPIDNVEQARALAIHGANCWGVDKLSFDDRCEWVENTFVEIQLAAINPLECTWWMDADDPWQFLAFCFEWEAFQDHGYGYVSHLPVARDGSCNGLQHFSAMLRDPVGGAATNLMPSDAPADIYQEVADVVTQKLRDIVGEHDELARKWLEVGISRKTVKRPVMVLPYGGTPYSCREYIEEWLRGETQEEFADKDFFKASKFLAEIVWSAIGEVVVAARRAMDWIQKSAKAAAREGLPLLWTTPDGFPVTQAYEKFRKKRVKTRLGDHLMYIQIQEEVDNKLDIKRQGQGASPNFVHSMDATALRQYVMLARDNGVTAFGLVHDSFATHAADIEVSDMCIRQAFVDMYQHSDVLNDLRQSLVDVVDDPASIPPVPPSGDLDLETTLQAPYFFA